MSAALDDEPAKGTDQADHFYEPITLEKSKYKSNICGRITNTWMAKLIRRVNKNGKMKQEWIESLDMDDSVANDDVKRLQANIYAQVKKQGKNVDWGKVVTRASFTTFSSHIIFFSVLGFFGEGSTLVFSYLTGEVVSFIQDENAKLEDAIWLMALFTVLIFIGSTLRNMYMQHA